MSTQDTAHSALLVMDVQHVVLGRVSAPDYLPRLRTAIDAARGAGMPVIYVVVGFRPGFPEVSPRNRAFGALAASGRFGGEEQLAVPDEVAPAADDVVVVKKRISAFSGSDLDMVLRAREIHDLVLTGIATSGVVLSTLRQAADLDFGLTVLSDGCLDFDPEVHRVLTGKVFPMTAEVTTVDQWAAGLDRAATGAR